MRLYCFVCDNCGYTLYEHIESLDATVYKTCPNCNINILRRNYRAEQVSFILRGNGFYANDHRDRQEV